MIMHLEHDPTNPELSLHLTALRLIYDGMLESAPDTYAKVVRQGSVTYYQRKSA